MTDTSISLDENGNINTKKLEKALRSALDFDIKYKKTDNMKKRACKTAGNYSEFKAMVDCAHLKTVNRTEIESLREVKKGWKKENSQKTVNVACILSEEEKKSQNVVNNILKSSKLQNINYKAPKTLSEFERDFRRIGNNHDRVRYRI